jgi:hypothetical protein
MDEEQQITIMQTAQTMKSHIILFFAENFLAPRMNRR